MSIALYLKDNLKNIPPGLGRVINKVPYALRPGLGRIYRQRKAEIELYDCYTNALKQEFILGRIKPLVAHAYQNIPFYRKYYDSHGFKPEHLKTFDDIARIPIVEKAI